MTIDFPLVILVFVALLWGTKIMADVSTLAAKVQAIEEVVPRIAEDYQTMLTLVEELREQVTNPETQEAIDAMAARLAVTLDALHLLDASVPNPEPEPEPEPIEDPED